MEVSKRGQALLHHHEGLRLEAYLCPAGVWTIGYGTTRIDGRPVRPGERITKAEAERLFREDLRRFEKSVSSLVKVPMTQGQFDALVSFAYNVGVNAFRNSTLLRLLNKGDFQGAADQLPRWNKGGGKVLTGLVRRREDERQLFLETPESQAKKFHWYDEVEVGKAR